MINFPLLDHSLILIFYKTLWPNIIVKTFTSIITVCYNCKRKYLKKERLNYNIIILSKLIEWQWIIKHIGMRFAHLTLIACWLELIYACFTRESVKYPFFIPAKIIFFLPIAIFVVTTMKLMDARLQCFFV